MKFHFYAFYGIRKKWYNTAVMYTFKNTYFQQHTVCLLLISTSVSSNFFVCDTMCHSCQCNMMMHKCWTRKKRRRRMNEKNDGSASKKHIFTVSWNENVKKRKQKNLQSATYGRWFYACCTAHLFAL